VRKRQPDPVASASPAPAHGLESDATTQVIDRRALDDLFSLTYEELRRLATKLQRSERHVSLSPTALVNEAWLRLARSRAFRATSRLHFKRIAARAMRQILVDAARRRQAEKRGRDFQAVTFDEALDQSASTSRDLLALNAALDDLARVNPRHAVMVESRYFGGLEVAEVAALLEVSEATVLRDWRAARAWLASQVAHGVAGRRPGPSPSAS
jgi:RNA polymerase sigma factor (TIGR02999 family)